LQHLLDFSEHRINVEIIKLRLDGGKLGVKLQNQARSAKP
jgi:hypothetical protein